MTTKNCVLCVLFIVFNVSCTAQISKVDDSREKRIIDLDRAKMNLDAYYNYSMLYKSVKIIPLETNKSCLIGTISKIRVFDQYILVLDAVKANSLYVFDKEGRFIRKIGGVGQGPGEYVSISDFTIDRVNKTVAIRDGRLQRINKYDLATGKFIGAFKLMRDVDRAESSYFEYIGGKLYSDAYFEQHSDNNYLLRIIDESSGKGKKYFLNVMEYNKGVSNTIDGNHFSPFYLRDNSDAVFIQQFMSQIFEITNTGVFSYIELKGKNLFTPEEAKKAMESIQNRNKNRVNNRNFDDYIFKINKYFRVISYLEKRDWIIIDMPIGFAVHRILFNKKTNEVTIFRKIFDDVLLREKDKGSSYSLCCYDSNGAYYHTATFRSTGVPELQALSEAGVLSPDVIGSEKLKKIDKEDNPILLYYEFKE